MYLHLGQDIMVRTDEIIGIFDMDNTTVAKGTRRLLAQAEKNGQVIPVTDDLPKTFVLCGRGEGGAAGLPLPDLLRHPAQADTPGNAVQKPGIGWDPVKIERKR